MRKFIINEKQSNRRIDRILRDKFPQAPSSSLHKALRKKDVKVNGVRIREDYNVKENDIVEVYIKDDILDGAPLKSDSQSNRGFSVVYEDNNMLIVNKEQ